MSDETFPIRVYLRDTVTGFMRTHDDTAYLDDDGQFADFLWSEGNYSCDCNRSLFITDWGKVGPPGLRELGAHEAGRCLGDGRIVVDKIERLDTGEVVYTEDD